MARLTPEELEAAHRDPAARETFGAAGPLILDLSVPQGATPEAAAWLAELPAPVIGIGDRAHPLAPACDALAETPAAAERLAGGAARSPLAAMTLVQLLRATERLAPAQAFALESMAYATLQRGPEFAAWLAARPLTAPARPEPSEPLRVERSGGRLELTLARPAAFNAIDVRLRDALVEALQLAVADDSVTEVALQGEGRAFSIGGELSEFGAAPDPASAHRVRSLRLPGRAALACAERLQARVHGACIGAGVEIAAFARRVSARPDAFFQLPELRMGLIPGAGGCVSLPRRIGRQRTVELVLSGRRIGARTALAWGLVDAIEA